jgi:hypothetical protein
VAGDWIKMRGNLWDDPRIAKLVDMTDSSEAQVIGALYWIWSTADQHTEDGVLPGLSLKSIDRKTGLNGFAASLVSIGWLSADEAGVQIVDFESHNGTSAKKRLETAKRVAKHKAKVTSATDFDDDANEEVTLLALALHDFHVTDALPRERERVEKERREKRAASLAAKLPPCPHDALIDLSHQHAPSLPRTKKEFWGKKQKAAMDVCWTFVLTETKSSDGTRYAHNKEEALDYFARMFAYVERSDFLSGRNGKWTHCELAWLFTWENFRKINSGKYENDKDKK